MDIIVLLSNIDIILIVLLLIVAAVFVVVRFLLKPKGKQKKIIMSFLKHMVLVAEIKYGSKKGQLKISYVWTRFTERYPVIKLFITQKQFEALVDEALGLVKESIDEIKNKEVK